MLFFGVLSEKVQSETSNVRSSPPSITSWLRIIPSGTAESASFTRAADKLNLTQSTDSTHIQGLEQELDSQLILRGARRKLELTETGRRVYAAAKEILNRCEALESMRESSDAATLSIATSTVPAQQLLPKLMSGEIDVSAVQL